MSLSALGYKETSIDMGRKLLNGWVESQILNETFKQHVSLQQFEPRPHSTFVSGRGCQTYHNLLAY